MQASIVLLPGDGIGPEVVQEAHLTLERTASLFGHTFSFDEGMVGGIAIEKTGTALPDETLHKCQSADAVLLGAVGGPQWDDPNAPVRPEQGLLKIRKEMQLFANLRPVKVFPQLIDSSPLKWERLEGVDILMLRELTGGIYFGEPRGREPLPGGGERGFNSMVYTTPEIERIVRLAFRLAEPRRKKVTSVDKANVLDVSRLWRQVTIDVAKDFPDVRLEHQLVDSAAMRLITNPASIDVLVTENMFGDILTDEASVLAGSLGMLPSASLSTAAQAGSGPGLYEPIHGSAPDIAGKGIANPLATILSAAMLLRHSLGLEAEAASIEAAVSRVLDSGARTADLDRAQYISTQEMGQAVRDALLAS